MNIKSIKFRLTLWYFLAFIISASAILGSFYYVTRQTLLGQTDEQIRNHAEGIAAVISSQSSGIRTTFLTPELEHRFADMPGMLIIIAGPNGEVLARSQLVELESGVIADLVEKSTNIINPVYVNRMAGSTLMRFGIFPVAGNGQTRELVFVGHPIDVVTLSLNRLLETMAIILGGIGVLAIAGAWGLARGALEPVTHLSRKLQDISSTNLNQQVAVTNTGDEIQELSMTFNSLLGRLSQSFERERQFIGDVAHELKTPLATLKNTIEVSLLKKRSQMEYRELLANTLGEINSLAFTINDVLDLAWAESDKAYQAAEKVDMSKLVNEVYEITQKLAEPKGIRVSGHISPGGTIGGKRQKLFRALFNLADNAVKYTPRSGEISFKVQIHPGVVQIEITNSGPGIASLDLPHIFDRFYRGKKGAAAFGAGLGLAICRSIIEAHRGSITASSQPDKMTRFIIKLPSFSS